ncbi:MAG: hypothetical protein PUF97_00445 [Bifidobacteriaceae bacterium]|nr:hypothetical protein [Bifidobacteriaceae bacterium]
MVNFVEICMMAFAFRFYDCAPGMVRMRFACRNATMPAAVSDAIVVAAADMRIRTVMSARTTLMRCWMWLPSPTPPAFALPFAGTDVGVFPPRFAPRV